MKHTIVASLSSILIVAVMSTSIFFFYAVPRADAQALGDIAGSCGANAALDFLIGEVGGFVMGLFSTEVPTSDSKAQTNIVKADLRQCLQALEDLAFKVALAQMKKRLLDRLTDDTVAWISGQGGTPRFITNFGDVVKETGDAALGDTLRAAGMGKLCSERLGLQVQLSLRQVPKFSQGVTCTLSGAAANVAAFGDNFKNGGWIGYGQLLNPSNNRWGLELLSADQLQVKGTGLAESAKLKVGTSQGYTGTSYCSIWTLTGVRTGDDYGAALDIVDVSYDAFGDPRSPNEPPGASGNRYDATYLTSNDYPTDFPGNYSQLAYICKPENIQTTTPAAVLAASTNQAVTSDANAIVSMDDLSPYISALFDAAVNRLISEGVRGLSNITRSQSGQGGYPTPGGNNINGQLATQARTNYNAVQTQITNTQNQIASANTQNAQAVSNLMALASCQRDVCSGGGCANGIYEQPVFNISPMFVSCPNVPETMTALNASSSELGTLSGDLTNITNAMTTINAQITSNSSNQSSLITIIALLGDLAARALNITNRIQAISNSTNATANRISGELATCSASQASGTQYSCPMW